MVAMNLIIKPLKIIPEMDLVLGCEPSILPDLISDTVL